MMKKLLFKSIPRYALFHTIVAYTLFINNKASLERPIAITLFLGLIILSIIGEIIMTNLRLKQVRLLSIHITDNEVESWRNGERLASIRFSEISSIKDSSRGITVIPSNSWKNIFISKQIDNYKELKEYLAEISSGDHSKK